MNKSASTPGRRPFWSPWKLCSAGMNAACCRRRAPTRWPASTAASNAAQTPSASSPPYNTASPSLPSSIEAFFEIGWAMCPATASMAAAWSRRSIFSFASRRGCSPCTISSPPARTRLVVKREGGLAAWEYGRSYRLAHRHAGHRAHHVLPGAHDLAQLPFIRRIPNGISPRLRSRVEHSPHLHGVQ